MSREVRKVPASWDHPREQGRTSFCPLFDGSTYEQKATAWDEGASKWASGEFDEYAEESDKALPYENWAGPRPNPADYMPIWPESKRTHFMMYETTTEGTPISPAFESLEDLARWLAENATAYANETAGYDAWLEVCKAGSAEILVLGPSGLRSAVAALNERGSQASE